MLDGDEQKCYVYNTSIRIMVPPPVVVARPAAQTPADIRPEAPPVRPIPGQVDIASLEVRVQGIGVIIANAQAELEAVMQELAALRIGTSH
jgi:hypothetical protein